MVGDTGVSLQTRDGPVTVRWAELVGAAVDDEEGVTVLFGADGAAVPFASRWFRSGAAAAALIEARVPPHAAFRCRAADLLGDG